MSKYGFTFRWMFHPSTASWPFRKFKPLSPDLNALDFLAKHGFNYVRLPVSYWFWARRDDFFHPDESMVAPLDGYLQACQERGLQLCLGLNRAPGHCIDAPRREIVNLWRDEVAQQGFDFTWHYFASRYRDVPGSQLCFELICDPPAVGERSLEEGVYERLMRQTVQTITAVSPQREIMVTGLDRGRLPLPSLVDLPVIQSLHAFEPMKLTHFETTWWLTQFNRKQDQPDYPQLKHNGIVWNRQALIQYLAPWRELEATGVSVHVGDFGCFNRTDNWAALSWFTDLMGLFKDYGWGYCLGGFDGQFGMVNHGRPNTYYRETDGYMADRRLLELMKESRGTRLLST